MIYKRKFASYKSILYDSEFCVINLQLKILKTFLLFFIRKTIIICVVVVVFAVALVFTIKQRSWRNIIYSYLKRISTCF